jgi:Kef-type K+ transport system membrane component KefB
MLSAVSFLPQEHLQLGNLLLFGILLLTGLLGGHVFQAGLRLPKITGFVVAGMLLGPVGLNWLSEDMLDDSQVFVNIGLGLVLFELGNRLDLAWMRRDQWLLATSVAEATLSFGFVYAALSVLGVGMLVAGLLAAVAVSTSPAVVTLIVKDLRAEGQLTERALSLTALNNVIAFFIIAALLPLLHIEHSADGVTVIAPPLYLLIGSLLLAFALSVVCLQLAAWLGKREDRQFVLLVCFVVIAVGAATALKLSELLTVLGFGILTRNLDRKRVLLPVDFGRGGELFIIVLFVVAGARLRVSAFQEAVWIGAIIVIARFAGKFVGLGLFARPNGFTLRRVWHLSLVMLPLSSTMLTLIQGAAGTYPEMSAQLSTALFLALAVFELLGPVTAQWGLQHAGESHPES